jgi:hypothetical protein
MPIQKLYRVRCDCGNFLTRLEVPRQVSVSVVQSNAMLFTSYQDAQEEAKTRGWRMAAPGSPLACPPCSGKED